MRYSSENIGNDLVQIFIIRGGRGRELYQVLADARIILRKIRQHFMAQRISQIGRIRIRLIQTGRVRKMRQIGFDFRPCDAEKRAHDTAVSRPHAAKPRQTRTAQYMMKHGFRLVIGMMRHGKQSISLLLAQLFKRSVTQFPRRGFDRFSGHPHRLRNVRVQTIKRQS